MDTPKKTVYKHSFVGKQVNQHLTTFVLDKQTYSVLTEAWALLGQDWLGEKSHNRLVHVIWQALRKNKPLPDGIKSRAVYTDKTETVFYLDKYLQS